MNSATWFGVLPGIAVAALTAYLGQRRLQRVERAWSRRAQAPLDLVDALGEHVPGVLLVVEGHRTQ